MTPAVANRGLGWAACLVVAGVVACAAPTSALAQDEVANVAKGLERRAVFSTPDYQARLLSEQTANVRRALAARLADPERDFTANTCATGIAICPGDVRLYDWAGGGHGLVAAVLFTARNGATLSGHVWATRAGPARRPGIVITNGSLGGPEWSYWWAAQALAKHGYVVLTFDPQGQGLSDTRGETPDENEGVPAQITGTPFFDGTQDALDFLLSTPDAVYTPRPSRGGHVHEAKQRRRVLEGFNAEYNPFWKLLDRRRIGLAGHSYGAQGASWVGQQDPRVSAIVAWDNLCVPTDNPSLLPDDAVHLYSRNCLVGGAMPAPALTKPALGLSADYGFVPVPYIAPPDPLAKSSASLALTQAGVDTGEIVIRGGTHEEFSFIPSDAAPGHAARDRSCDLVRSGVV